MVAADAATADNDLAFSALVTGFEVLELTGATGAQTVVLANLGLTSSVTVGTHAANGTLTLTGLVNGGTVTIAAQTGTADILALSNTAWAATGSSSDAVNVNIGGAAVASNTTSSGTLSIADVESVTLNATHATVTSLGAAIAAGTYSNAIAITDTSTTDVLANLVVTGNAAVALDLTGATALRTINASSNTGGVTVTAVSTLASTITGGSGDDSLTAKTGTNADTLVGGGGDDTLTSNAGLTTLTGGAGNDVFVVATAGANSGIYTTITDFAAGDKLKIGTDLGTETFATAKIVLAGTASFADYLNAASTNTTGALGALTNGTISWFQFEGNTYVVEDRSTDATFKGGTDIVVGLTGLVDLSTASLAYDAGGVPTLAIV
jgi:S-layer protein